MNELDDKITYTTTEFSDEQRMLKYGETPLKKNLLQQITFDNEGVSLSMRSGKSYTFRKGQYTVSWFPETGHPLQPLFLALGRV